MIYVVLILAVLVIILGIVCGIVIRSLGKKKKENEDLKKEIERNDSVVKSVYSYIESVAKVNAEGIERIKEIDNAKSDEEINDIISDIFNANNNRVSDGSAEKQG